ncbi:AI-2E family transporter [uncultured archaeon]|nr:AI-2E family transporter [uncultured archaeon]
MDNEYFRKIATIAIVGGLMILSFLMLRPILMSIIMGFLLAFIFSPIYNILYKWTKSKGLPAAILVFLLLALIIIPVWIFMPTIIDESIKFYRASQQLDIVTPLTNLFPSIFNSKEFTAQVGVMIHSFITKMTNSLMNYFADILLDLPNIAAQVLVVFFTFYYALRDKDAIINYVKSLLPFSKEVEKKLFDSTRDITFSVLYGQVLIGLVQGIILGIGFFAFGVPNPFILTLIAIFLCALPIIGPTFVGVPVAIFLLIGGNSFSAMGVLVFTLISSFSDHFTRPLFVAKLAKLHTGLVIIGMVGGFFLFGILGFILGPLIIAYLIIITELYRNKNVPSVLIEPAK